MKAVKKPIPIEVEEFNPGRLPWPKGVEHEAGSYIVFNELHGARIQIEAGDFVNVSNEHDLYPIKRDIFYATYEVL